MAYQSLYRRYRSQKFAEILGQPHVTTALQAAIAEQRHGHAYLFSGPRGTGKTSTARVLAKALNCENLTDGEPCGTCESCVAIESGKSFDLHELDAASHNKVDDIRDLISKVQLGSPGRTKVYILDEVHMLSSGAENALLKTLEEPPDHVVFVLATTEPQKVVPTIRSRTQHFEFHLLPADVLADHVRSVVADAGLDVGEEAVDYVLRQGGGSARDTLSALDLVAAAGGIPEGSDVAESLVRAIGQRDAAAAIAAIQDGLELGREPRTVGEDTLDLLRNAFLASMGASLDHLNDTARQTSDEVAGLLGPATLTRSLEAIGQAMVEMRQAPDPRVPLEVTVLRLTRGGTDDETELHARIEALEARIEALEAGRAAGPTSVSPPAATAAAATPPADAPVAADSPTDERADATSAAPPAGVPPNSVGTDDSPLAGARRAAASAGRATGGGSNQAGAGSTTEARSRAPRAPRSPRAGQAPRQRGNAAPGGPSETGPSAEGGPTTASPSAEGTAATAPPNQVSAAPADAALDKAAPDRASPVPADAAPGTTAPDETTAAGPAGNAPADTANGDVEPTRADAPAAGPGGTGQDGPLPEGTEASGQPAGGPTSAGTSPPGAGTGAAAGSAGANIDLATATEALRARLDDLSQKVRARFKGGRILDVDGATVRFGAPNQIHRDRCEDVKGDVEQALTEHFGQAITVEVVIDTATEAPTDPAKLEPKPAPSPVDTSAEEAEIGPVADLADATDQSARGVDRITKAFPGSQVVDTGLD